MPRNSAKNTFTCADEWGLQGHLGGGGSLFSKFGAFWVNHGVRIQEAETWGLDQGANFGLFSSQNIGGPKWGPSHSILRGQISSCPHIRIQSRP